MFGGEFRAWTYSHAASREHVIEAKTLRTPEGNREYTIVDAPVQSWTFGTWGGSTQYERWALRALPASEALEILEGSFEARLQARITAWRGIVSTRQAVGKHGRYDKRLTKMLAERESGRVAFTLGGRGGPGRGHRGPAYAYAQQHRCSMTTARKRLHVAA
jgi:hypothetical protein